jgi:hypothetical protein
MNVRVSAAINNNKKNQNIHVSLVGLVVIDAEFDRKDHDSIPATAIGRRLKPLDVRTDLQTRLNRW